MATLEELIGGDAAAEFYRVHEQRRTETAAWRSKMATIRSPLVLKLLELHHPNERGGCDGCDMDGYECDHPEWPCRTVCLIGKHFGRPAPEWVELP